MGSNVTGNILERIELIAEKVFPRVLIVTFFCKLLLYDSEGVFRDFHVRFRLYDKKLQDKINKDADKVCYYNQCSEAADKSLLSFRETASILNIPEKRFIEALLNADIVYRRNNKLMPYAKYLDKGFFRLVEWVSQTNGYYYQTKITPSGQLYLNNNFEKLEKSCKRYK